MRRIGPCPDPESFVRRGPILTTFFLNTTIYKAGHHQPDGETPILNGILLAYRCWPNIEYWCGSFVIFRGMLETLYFLIFHGGGSGPSVTPLLDPRMWFPYYMAPTFNLFTPSEFMLSCGIRSLQIAYMYSKCSKISNTFLFLFSNKMLVIRAGIHKIVSE